MGVDPVSRALTDRVDDGPQTGVVDVGGSAARRADDVVMVGWLAADVRVLAGRQVEPLDDAQLEEQVERPKDRRPTDREVTLPCIGGEVGRGEVALAAGDQLRNGTPRLGQPMAGTIERVDDGS